MCGIAVVMRLGARPLPDAGVMDRMLAAIAHRGPDGRGQVTLDDRVMLGNVRLAVIDPHGGRQPVSGCGSTRVTCVYNGELYDAPEHRAQLAPRHEIPDHCDTSLLPHLYEEQGDDMVRSMRGMFAFALWDGSRRRLLLARDRLGIKPLFYATTADFLIAASEMKGIFASGLVQPEIDRDALDDLFSLSYPCPPRTMFRGVVELRPGHRLTVHEGRRPAAPQRWWRTPFRPRGEYMPGSAADVEHAFRRSLEDAVRTHLVADVPVAARVSGGIDSSAVAALAARETGGRLTTFSIVFDDARYDERAHARAVADHIGAGAREVLADGRCAERLPEMIRALEMPQPVPVAIGGLLLAERERAEGVPVVVTGEGADEILGGYDVFRASRARRALARPWARPFRRLVYRAVERATRQPAGLAEFLVAGASRDAAVTRAFRGLRPPWLDVWRMLDLERDALLGVGGRRVRPIDEPPEGFGDLVRDDVTSLDPLDAELALELETRLPSWILVIGDRTAMAHGVEMRVPFLDHRVVELAAAIPPHMKMSGLREKAVLRGAVKDLLPRRIVNRRKQPFMTPVRSWFFTAGAPAFVHDALSRRAVEDAGLFTPDAVARLRQRLDASIPGSLEGIRLELVMMLILGTQLLHDAFVSSPAR